ncbi:hypothetical protein JCM11251_004984 [Rhodosporidiobolus azoricus]
MSTPDDLTPAVNALTIASSESLSLSSTFTLVCSGGERVTVEAALLSSTSTVFKDMLEAGSGALDCEVAESAVVIKLLIKALKTGEVPRDKMGWQTLYELQDKYDIQCLKGALLCEGWRAHVNSPFFAYAVGSLLGDTSLMIMAAEQSLGKDHWHDRGALFHKLPKGESERLLDYRNAHVERMVRTIQQVPLGRICPCDRERAHRNTVGGIWVIGTEQATMRLQPLSDPVQFMSREVGSRSSRCLKCKVCTNRLDCALGELERRWSEVQKSRISLF